MCSRRGTEWYTCGYYEMAGVQEHDWSHPPACGCPSAGLLQLRDSSLFSVSGDSGSFLVYPIPSGDPIVSGTGATADSLLKTWRRECSWSHSAILASGGCWKFRQEFHNTNPDLARPKASPPASLHCMCASGAA